MKKLIRLFLLVFCSALLLPINVTAALTPAQQRSIVHFTEDFLKEGNKRNLLQYGNVENYKTIQGQLVHCTGIYQPGTTSRILWMNPFVEGDYLTISCVGFVDMMLKNSLGIRLEYVYSPSTGHASNWESYFFRDIPSVTRFDGKGTVPLFTLVWEKTKDPSLPKGIGMAMKEVDESILEVGDLIVGTIDATDPKSSGHAVLVGEKNASGNRVIYQASSNPKKVGGVTDPHLVRDQELRTIDTLSYDVLRVYRFSDGVFDPDFPGYDVKFDFDSLSTQKSVYDTEKPRIRSVSVGKISGSQYPVTVYATDESSDSGVSTLASDPSTVIRGDGYGQSGVLAYYVSKTKKPPSDPYSSQWVIQAGKIGTKNTFSLSLSSGTYYLWVKDCAGNVSEPWKFSVSPFSSLPKGDANNDGKVDLKDAILTAKHIEGTEKLLGLSFSAADLDENGRIDVKDFTKLIELF